MSGHDDVEWSDGLEDEGELDLDDEELAALAEPIIVLMTFPHADVAKKIAQRLVADQLAACVNLAPGVHSVYRWEGKVESRTELIGLIKTRSDLLGEILGYIEEAHPDEVPEFLALPIEAGSPDYVEWLLSQLRPPLEDTEDEDEDESDGETA